MKSTIIGLLLLSVMFNIVASLPGVKEEAATSVAVPPQPTLPTPSSNITSTIAPSNSTTTSLPTASTTTSTTTSTTPPTTSSTTTPSTTTTTTAATTLKPTDKTTTPTPTKGTTTTSAPSPPTQPTAAPEPGTTSSPPSPPSPSKGRHFDGLSFMGGIILTACLVGISVASYKFYKIRTDLSYRTL